jgi:4-hydroxyphenylpyruvate dioxygenase
MSKLSNENPCGLNGFEFLEFSSLDNDFLIEHIEQLGFAQVGKHRSKEVFLYRQGNINFIVNAEKETQAHEHAKTHGSGACAMAFKVSDAQKAYKHALENGAHPFHPYVNSGECEIPAIKAIGGSVIYFVDEKLDLYETDFEMNENQTHSGYGLEIIDHLTHNVQRGNMDKWADFYHRIFNFHEIRFFDIKGKMTGLFSRAMESPCGKIKIPLNEATDDKSQIEEFLQEYNGEGIQHIALTTERIHESVESLLQSGIQFLDVPDTYYEMVGERIPWHSEDLERMKKNKILIDGGNTPEGGLLLQIFTENMFGPAFFEIIQRKGNNGFGEGNFQALFEAIERDQIKRGTLKEKE